MISNPRNLLSSHTGAITTQHLTPPLRQRWAVDFGQNISYPLIADGKVFVTVRNASSGTTLFALDAANGAQLWSFSLGGFSQRSGLCYENGRVFAVNGSGLLRAFDGATDSVIWQRQLSGQSVFSAPPTVSDGVITPVEQDQVELFMPSMLVVAPCYGPGKSCMVMIVLRS